MGYAHYPSVSGCALNNLLNDQAVDHNENAYVQYGCGFSAPVGWRNFDASPTLRFERIPFLGKLYQRNSQRFPANVDYGDIVAGLPLTQGRAKYVFASHVLEHLALDDFRTALTHTFRLLRPGGYFRLIVPDLEQLAQHYKLSSDSGAALDFIRATGMGTERRARGLTGVARRFLGNSAHLWLWDYKSLSLELESAGFVGVRRCQFGDSHDPRLTEVEVAGRYEAAVGVECQRP